MHILGITGSNSDIIFRYILGNNITKVTKDTNSDINEETDDESNDVLNNEWSMQDSSVNESSDEEISLTDKSGKNSLYVSVHISILYSFISFLCRYNRCLSLE